MPSRALECFVGAWGILNATLTNTNTGLNLPEWHSIYPSGISVCTASGYNAFILTANDTTEHDLRPLDPMLPAADDNYDDDDRTWALVARHSLATGGPFKLFNLTDSSPPPDDDVDVDDNDGVSDSDSDGGSVGGGGAWGPAGTVEFSFTTSTLRGYVGSSVAGYFEFFDDCSVKVLRTWLGPDLVQTVFFRRLPGVYEG
ncbi:hypothetical protein F4778DRAFT_727100 [Xylariomycetidae sp. FL2044]|nr:hypothetical protein F4778DRAFT_727100 [Xylariomycetidae sp. FL2044]